MRLRLVAATLAALVALAPLASAPVLAVPSRVTPTTAAAEAIEVAPKVVVVVGAVEGLTASYRADADKIAAEALKYTPNVIKIYSPNATWAKVKAAAQGASIFVYLGHGYGFPSPYRAILSPSVQNGLGLNEIGGIDDNDKKYYGETFIANEIRLAKDAIVLLNHLCYSAGSSESGHAEPTMSVARQRVDNYASGFIKAGARTVIAQSWTSGVVYTVGQIFTSDRTLLNVWQNAPNQQGNQQPFVPVRNPQFEGRVDPETPTTSFRRSIVSATGHRTTQILAGAGVAQTGGITAAADASGPELWSVDGPTTLRPNFDGVADSLNLLARFSETVSWTATIKNANGDVVRTQTGAGHQAPITWNVTAGSAPAPPGNYSWELDASDAAGNPPLHASGPLVVQSAAVPTTGVLSFKPTTPLMTTVGTISYALKFNSAISGLTKSDFTITGTSPGCLAGPPVGGPVDWTITLTGCQTGTVGLYLNAGQVVDAALVAGPGGPIIAARVTIDATVPKATAPKPSFRTDVQLAGPSSSQALPLRLTWTGSDSGSGVASYDVQRSANGGTWTTLAAATTATSLDVTVAPGTSYRFQVRARDKAGNVGAYAATSTWYPSLVQNSSTAVTWSGTWGTNANVEYSGGSVKYTQTAGGGGAATYSFSGRAVAWVTTLRENAGPVEVWVDGALAATVTPNAATSYRQVVFSRAWTTYGSHTIKLVVVGTAEDPRAELDAFELLK